MLWKNVRSGMRRNGRGYQANQLAEAEAAMQDALDEDEFAGYGLAVLSAQIDLDWDGRSREHAIKLEQIRLESQKEAALAEVENIRARRNLENQKSAVDFYKPLISEGNWQLLALALSQNQMDARSIMEYLDTKQREQLGLQFKILETLLEKDALPETFAEGVATNLLREVMQTISVAPLGLPTSRPNTQQSDSAGASPSPSTDSVPATSEP
jgi:hypothetical protein